MSNIKMEKLDGSTISFVGPSINLKSGYVFSFMCLKGVSRYNNITISDNNIYKNTDSRTHESRTLSFEMSTEEIEKMGNLLVSLSKELKEKDLL